LIFQGDTKKIHEVKLEKSSGYAGMNGMPAGKVFNCKKDKKMLTWQKTNALKIMVFFMSICWSGVPDSFRIFVPE
jgi:hypothetical protein